MFDPNTALQIAATVLGMIGSGAGAFLWTKRKYFKDEKDISQGKVEINFMQGILIRMDAAYAAADKAWTERNGVMMELGSLRAENVFLKEHVKNLASRVEFLEHMLMNKRSRATDHPAGQELQHPEAHA